MEKGRKDMEKQVKPNYEDELRGLNEREFIIHRINQILDSRINGETPKLF